MNEIFVIIEEYNSLKHLKLTKDYTYKYLSFAYKDKWFLSLKASYLFKDETKVKCLNNGLYKIVNYETYEEIHIYVFENDCGYNDYAFYENKDIVFSNNKTSNLVSMNMHVADKYFKIENKELDSNISNLYLNNKLYTHKQSLKAHDKIEYLGFVVYYYDEFIYANSFLTSIKLDKVDISPKCFKYNNYPKKFNQTLIYEEDNELLVKDLAPFDFDYKSNVISFSQMIPGVVMSLSMSLIAAFNVYNNLLEGYGLVRIIPLVIMPIALLITSLLIPSINKLIDKKKKKKAYKKAIKEYLDYLDDYIKEIDDKIHKYIQNEFAYCLDLKNYKDKHFYLNANSKYFGTLTLGYQKLTHAQSIPKSDVGQIKEKYLKIKETLDNKVPLFFHILEYDAVSIYVMDAFKNYRLNMIVLELALKNNFNELKIAVYSKENVINGYMSFIPHLFCNGERMIYDSENSLIKLDSLSIEIPIVLILLDNIEYKFKNPNIHVCYISSDKSKNYIGSKTIIDYYHQTGYVFDGKRNQFDYYDLDLDFDSIFYYLSSYNSYVYKGNLKTFKDFIENIDIKQNYLSNFKGLISSFAYKDDELFSLDLHESKSGPHGLIGGTTGSGKSELIVSLLLGLCIRYSPTYLNIILIDYKGGGILDSLTYKEKTVPHIVASINNIDESCFERLIVMIKNECKKRQGLFNRLSRLCMCSISNIDDYLNEDLDKYGLEKIAHLLIVVDEFAELKKNQGSFIKELISFSRIGRSLGLHLILSTQKPSGSIDDEIWSNSRFKIALKVQDERDSQDIIKSKSAALLNNPGEFYLLVDGLLSKAKALYSKADYYDKDDFEIEVLNKNLKANKKISIKGNKSISEASYFVNEIINTCDELKINVNKWDFNKPKNKSINQLINEYCYKGTGIVLGEIDDYKNSKKGLLIHPKKESIFIYSSRNNEINNIINSYKGERLIVISQKRINSIPDSLEYDDEEDILFLFKKLLKETVNATLIIEDINCLLSYNDDYFDYLYKIIKRKEITDLTIIMLSKNSQLSFKLLNSFDYKYCIGITDQSDVSSIFNMRSEYKADSYFKSEEIIGFVPALIEKNIIHKNKESLINRIPFIVEKENSLLGYSKNSRNKVYLSEEEKLTIVSYSKETLDKYKEYYDYPNIEIKEYDSSLLKENINNILWIGEGLSSQRLFYVSSDTRINEFEGYFIRMGKEDILRLVNNA